MNRKLLLSLFALLPLASGCVVFGGGGSIGDVTFTWSFQGKSCAQVPDVAKVYIQIPGETLESSGVYPCTSSGYPGIVLHNFLPGTYSFTIGAYDTYNTLLYTKTGSFTVDGDVAVDVDLSWAVGGMVLKWQLTDDGGVTTRTCTQAGVNNLYVNFEDLATGTMLYGLRADPTTWDPQSCNLTSVVYGYLPPGAYKIYVTGAGSSGAYYSANYSTPAASTPSVTITAGVFPTEAQAISVMLYWSP